MHRRLSILIGLLAALAVLAGCSHDGRALADPQPWQTTTTRKPPPTSAVESGTSKSGLRLSSLDFNPGGPAPRDTTCAGRNVFPQLAWSGLPAGTREIAVTLSDQTNPKDPLLLWLMAGITPDQTGLQAGTAPPGAFETLNDYGNPGYGNPCLDKLGEGRRDLQFRIYALPESSGLSEGQAGNDSWSEIQAKATDTASLLMRINPSGT